MFFHHWPLPGGWDFFCKSIRNSFAMHQSFDGEFDLSWKVLDWIFAPDLEVGQYQGSQFAVSQSQTGREVRWLQEALRAIQSLRNSDAGVNAARFLTPIVWSSKSWTFVSFWNELQFLFHTAEKLCGPILLVKKKKINHKTKQTHICLSSRVLIEKMMSSSTGDGSSSAAGSGDYINIKETTPPGWACC